MLLPVYRKNDIDPSILFDAACGDPDLMAELLEVFFDVTGQDLARMVDAVEAGDAASISKAAHKMVGSATACGLIGMASNLRELEHRCKQGLPTDADKRVRRVKVQLEQARMFFEKHVEERV